MKKAHEFEKFFKTVLKLIIFHKFFDKMFGLKSLILRFGFKSRRLDVRHPMNLWIHRLLFKQHKLELQNSDRRRANVFNSDSDWTNCEPMGSYAQNGPKSKSLYLWLKFMRQNLIG